jgi:hypothetical protein
MFFARFDAASFKPCTDEFNPGTDKVSNPGKDITDKRPLLGYEETETPVPNRKAQGANSFLLGFNQGILSNPFIQVIGSHFAGINLSFR